MLILHRFYSEKKKRENNGNKNWNNLYFKGPLIDRFVALFLVESILRLEVPVPSGTQGRKNHQKWVIFAPLENKPEN